MDQPEISIPKKKTDHRNVDTSDFMKRLCVLMQEAEHVRFQSLVDMTNCAMMAGMLTVGIQKAAGKSAENWA